MLITPNLILLCVAITSDLISKASTAPLPTGIGTHAKSETPNSLLPPIPGTTGRPSSKSIMRLRKAPMEVHSHSYPARNVTIPQRTSEEIQSAVRWFEEFGYISESLGSGAASGPSRQLTAALRKFQRYAQLPLTGVLDDMTIAQMAKPRCGEKDFKPVPTRQKRYILLRRRWQRDREINIQFKNYTTDMTIDQQESIMQYVVDQWNSAANAQLVFHQHGDHVPFPEINIHHTRYDNRGRPFKPYGVLAYAALPRNGDMFFDDTEKWSEYHHHRPISFSYLTVALHELGHSLGFAHSNVPSAVMYAFYGPNRHTLTADDIAGAVALFGPT